MLADLEYQSSKRYLRDRNRDWAVMRLVNFNEADQDTYSGTGGQLGQLGQLGQEGGDGDGVTGV